MKSNAILSIIASIFVVSCDKSSDPIQDDYLSIPDNSFETILINNGIDSDGVVNQQLLKSDAKEIATLDLSILSYGKINDLTGIEGFVNLKKLAVTQHNIEQINLSANTKLDTLYLGGNHLSSIDVSKNTNLIFLDVQSNELTSITGLSEAAKLKDLDLSWNYLQAFSIHNESLEILHLRNNDLESININGTVNLKNILLTTNQLTTIDLSTNVLLETLLISDNNLRHANLEHNSNLSHLYISSNSLISFDVSNNHKLIDLRIDRNPDLSCIKIGNGQNIPNLSISEYQQLNNICN